MQLALRYQLALFVYQSEPKLTHQHLAWILEREPLNFFYAWQQIELLYPYMPCKMLGLAERLFRLIFMETDPVNEFGISLRPNALQLQC